VRALPAGPPARRRGRRRARQLAHRHRVVVVRRAMAEVGHDQAAGRCGRRLGQCGDDQAVHRRGHRAVPAEPGTVGAAAPAGGVPGQAAQTGQQRPHRRGRPGRGRRQPHRGPQQVDGEVGGEGDRRLQVAVHRALGHRGRRGDRGPDLHRDLSRQCGRATRGGAEPVDPQRAAPPGEVGAVRARTPGRQPQTETATSGALRRGDGSRRGRSQGRGRGRREVGGGEVGGGELGGACRAGAEQPDRPGLAGDGQAGPPDRCCLDRHAALLRR